MIRFEPWRVEKLIPPHVYSLDFKVDSLDRGTLGFGFRGE